jgi:hypothetical protein
MPVVTNFCVVQDALQVHYVEESSRNLQLQTHLTGQRMMSLLTFVHFLHLISSRHIRITWDYFPIFPVHSVITDKR